MRQDVSALVSALMTIVRTQGAPSATATRQTSDQHEDKGGMETGDGDESTSPSREKEEQQNGRERVVLLMHETRVLSASDATRVLLLLAREVYVVADFFTIIISVHNTWDLVLAAVTDW